MCVDLCCVCLVVFVVFDGCVFVGAFWRVWLFLFGGGLCFCWFILCVPACVCLRVLAVFYVGVFCVPVVCLRCVAVGCDCCWLIVCAFAIVVSIGCVVDWCSVCVCFV